MAIPRIHYPFASSRPAPVPFTSCTNFQYKNFQPTNLVLFYSSIPQYFTRTTFNNLKLVSIAFKCHACSSNGAAQFKPCAKWFAAGCKGMQGLWYGPFDSSMLIVQTPGSRKIPASPPSASNRSTSVLTSSGKACRCPKPQPPPYRIFRTSFPTAPQIS